MNNDVNNNSGNTSSNIPIVNPVVPNSGNNSIPNSSTPVGASSTPEVSPVVTEVVPAPTVTPTPVMPSQVASNGVSVDTSSPVSDNSGAIMNENLKKVEINYTPPSKFKVFLMVLFFIFLLGFVIFLPDITSMVEKYKAGKNIIGEEKITTGKMICTLSNSTTNLDKNYELTFRFTDNKLEKTEFAITTRGDPTADEEELNKLASDCKQLSENVESLKGVSVRCEYSDGKLVENQKFDLANMDESGINEAFVEAGGNNPEYHAGQDIDQIERTMNASGYTCKREA